MWDAIYPGGVRVPLAYARTSGLIAFALGVFVLFGLVEPAAADFRLCNNTGSRVGVAVGYKDTDGWTTEGWWNLPSRTCETILKGNLVARYYYVYAIDYDHGGEWMGQAFMCTRDKEFTIRGIADCLARCSPVSTSKKPVRSKPRARQSAMPRMVNSLSRVHMKACPIHSPPWS